MTAPQATAVPGSLRRRVLATFGQRFGGSPDLIASAPGRVNLIGEHTDYNEGFVLPCAIGRYTLVAARRRMDRQVHVVAGDYDATAAFALDERDSAQALPSWSRYVRGMAVLLAQQGWLGQGAELAIAGDLPRDVGLSSSASLEVSVGLALASLAGGSMPDLTHLAQIAQRAEQEFAGCPCGIMDQLVSARALAQHALLIDCRSLGTRPIRVPPDTTVLIVHSGIARELAVGHYAARRAQCATVAAQLQVRTLRDLDLPALEAVRNQIEPVAWRRARHVITENARTLAAADLLERNDLAALGRVMDESHDSMRDDFEITLPAIDRLVQILQQAIGTRGGARMTGGGFGGAVVGLLPDTAVPEVIAAVRAGYRTPTGEPPQIMRETAVAGAALLE